MSEAKISTKKRFSLHGKRFEIVQLMGDQGGVWFAKSLNLAENVMVSAPSWGGLKKAMRGAVDAEETK